MNYMDKVSKRIVELREERGETQQELADAIGITRQSLSRYEIAARTINVDVLGELAKHFNVSADYLLGLSDVKSTEQDMKIACDVTGLSEDAVMRLHSTIIEKEMYKDVYNCMISNEHFHALTAVLAQFSRLNRRLRTTEMSSKEKWNKIEDFIENKDTLHHMMLCFQQLSTFYALGDMAKTWIDDVSDRLTEGKWKKLKEAALLIQIIIAEEDEEGIEFLRSELTKFSKHIEEKSHGKHNQTEE